MDKYNSLRRKIANGHEDRSADGKTFQPKAANMMEVEWDDELAVQAQM